jgi:hypothetical protein
MISWPDVHSHAVPFQWELRTQHASPVQTFSGSAQLHASRVGSSILAEADPSGGHAIELLPEYPGEKQ